MYKISSNPAVRYHEQQLRGLKAGVRKARSIKRCVGLVSVASAVSCGLLVCTNEPLALLVAVLAGFVAASSMIGYAVLWLLTPDLEAQLEELRHLPVDERTRMIVTDGFLGRKVTYVYEP